ncbi:MAG: sigma-70 family RNA polymerase sigma factor [Chloroflexi bacterium]|nr:sigma-70 family RNA polymerase sigma factor [Chloroflexota bacterium]
MSKANSRNFTIKRIPFFPNPVEAERLAAARGGDQREFSDLTEPYRRELQVHCYRILGSLHEAEDLVQETLLRAWRRLDTYQGRASFRAWLYKIATNACLDALDRARSRRLLPAQTHPVSDPQAPILPPASDISWLEPFPDEWLVEATAGPEARYSAYESVSLAFLIALQALPPRQRATLILSDVLDWPSREVAELLGLTVSAANSALHRARTTLAKHYHGRALEGLSPSAADERTRGLLERYVQVWETADVAGLVALLKEDATFAMPPSPSWYRGRAAIGVFMAATVFADEGMFPGEAAGRWRLQPTQANAQPAFAIYQRTGEKEYQAFGIHVLACQADRLAQIISFIDPSLPVRFGLPPTLTG